MAPVPVYVGSAERFAVHLAFREIDPAGLRGLALWWRREGGPWTRAVESLIADLPLVFAPAADGSYDLRVSRIGADGREDGIPEAGDLPLVRLVVDRVPPVVTWGPLDDAPAGGRASIRFRVEDRILPEDPRATVLWSPDGRGEWMRIADVPIRPGDNEAEIPIPRRAGAGNRLRVAVADRAGNVTEVTSPLSFAIIGSPAPGLEPAPAEGKGIARPAEVAKAPGEEPAKRIDPGEPAPAPESPRPAGGARILFKSVLEDTILAAGMPGAILFEAAGWPGGAAVRLAWRQSPERPWETLAEAIDPAAGRAAWRAPLGETRDGRLKLEIVLREGEPVASAESPGKVIIDPVPPTVTFGRVERAPDGAPSAPVTAEDSLSGIASLSAYMSRDGGATWRPAAIEDGRITLPAEAGSFGIRVASRDGAGNEIAPPKPGDAPQMTVRLGPLPRLTLENFHGGLYGGEAKAKIFWGFHAPGPETTTLRIELLAAGGGERAIAEIDAARGGFLWTLPGESGAYRIRLRADLPDGSTIACASREPFVIDAQPPVVRVPSNAIDANYMAEVEAEVLDEGPAGLADVALLIRRAGETAWSDSRRIDRNGARIRAFVGDLPEGEHLLRVRARDGAGNETTAPAGAEGIVLRIDRTPPAVVLRDATRDGRAAASIDAEDAGGILEIALDVSTGGGSWARVGTWRGGAVPPPRVDVKVPDGAADIVFRTKVVDRAGNAVEMSTPSRRSRPEPVEEPEAAPVPAAHRDVNPASRAASDRAFLQLEDLERRGAGLSPEAKAERIRIIEKNLQDAVRIDGTNARAYVGLALLERLVGAENPSRAIGWLREAVARDPSDAMALCNLGGWLLRAGNPAEARAVLERSLAIRDATDARYNLGLALLAEGSYERALGAFERALAGDPPVAAAREKIIVCLMGAGRLDDALAAVAREEAAGSIERERARELRSTIARLREAARAKGATPGDGREE